MERVKGVKKKIDEIFDGCYSKDLSTCPKHTIFQRGKACDELVAYLELLFPQPLDDKELEKAIQDILDTAITVDSECNEITKKAQILALLLPKIEEMRLFMIEQHEIECALCKSNQEDKTEEALKESK